MKLPTTYHLLPTTYQSGFSIVEMIIVVALTVMIIVSATSVLLTTILGGGRVNTTRALKQNGDYALAQMTTLIRNSVKILPNDIGQVCQAGMNQLRLKSLDEGITTLGTDSLTPNATRIASNSAYLTSDLVNVDSDIVVFDCESSDDGSITTINIRFTLSKGDIDTSRATEYGSQEFSQSVTIRSY